MISVTLIETEHVKLGIFVASALISQFKRERSHTSGLFVFGTDAGGESVLFNRNLHWISQLEEDSREAAILALANFLDAEKEGAENRFWRALYLVQQNTRTRADGSALLTLQSLVVAPPGQISLPPDIQLTRISIT